MTRVTWSPRSLRASLCSSVCFGMYRLLAFHRACEIGWETDEKEVGEELREHGQRSEWAIPPEPGGRLCARLSRVMQSRVQRLYSISSQIVIIVPSLPRRSANCLRWLTMNEKHMSYRAAWMRRLLRVTQTRGAIRSFVVRVGEKEMWRTSVCGATHR